MSLFTDLDDLYSQTDQLLARAEKYSPPDPTPDNGSGTNSGPKPPTPPPPKPSPCGPTGCPPGFNCVNGKCIDPNTGKTKKQPVLKKTNAPSGSAAKTEAPNTVDSILDSLKQVDHKVWYGLGGGVVLLLLIGASKN